MTTLDDTLKYRHNRQWCIVWGLIVGVLLVPLLIGLTALHYDVVASELSLGRSYQNYAWLVYGLAGSVALTAASGAATVGSIFLLFFAGRRRSS